MHAEPYSATSVGKLRLLVVIASYGVKNLPYLDQVIESYQKLSLRVDVVVISDGPKQVAEGVTVVVGLPSRDPWSLPFAHKNIFARNVDKYDLFAYSEDDIEVTEAHIQSFLRITPELKEDEIAGYDLYEIGDSGQAWMPGVHGAFHWKPDSVGRRGPYTIAQFTNEHAGFYLLTQNQLRRAISSGGFLRRPYAGRYDMLCAAATDPYTSCGFRKVICISQLDHFLLRHLPDRYVGKRGLSLSVFKDQVRTLEEIEQGRHPVTTLVNVEPRIAHDKWSKSYYEPPNEALIDLIPNDATHILSIGCGSGATEARLIKNGAQVTALPLDSVIGAIAAQKGIKIIYGTLTGALTELNGTHFDCLIVSGLLHLMRDPAAFLGQCVSLLRPKGTLVVSGPNFDYLPILVRRLLRLGDYGELQNFDLSGINTFSMLALRWWLRDLRLELEAVSWKNPPRAAPLSGSIKQPAWPRRIVADTWNWLRQVALPGIAEDSWTHFFAMPRGRLFAKTWIVRARREP